MTTAQRHAAKLSYDAVAALASARQALAQAGIDIYTDPGYAKLDQATEEAKTELAAIAHQLQGDPVAEEFDVDESNVNLDQPDYRYQRL